MKNIKIQIILLIILILMDCGIGAYIGYWREGYWQSLANKDIYKWAIYIAEFSLAALVSCFLSGYSNYIGNIISLRYREKFTKKALELKNYVRVEGGAQRVQEDCNSYPSLLIQLITGLFRSIIMIGVFASIIVIQLPLKYLALPIIYTIIGTYLAARIAKPLIKLNYINQVVEAKFRAVLHEIEDRLKTHSTFAEVYQNNFNLFRSLKFLQYFQSFYNQITIIIPHVMLIFLYFSGRITFGIFMQVASSMAELINNLSYFINSFDVLNRFLSCRKRLKELGII